MANKIHKVYLNRKTEAKIYIDDKNIFLDLNKGKLLYL